MSLIRILGRRGGPRFLTTMLAPGATPGDVLTVQEDGSIEPAAPGEGGGSLPDEWTVAANGGLAVDISDLDGSIVLRESAQIGTKVESSVIDNGDGTGTAALIVQGTAGGGANIVATAGGATGGTASLSGNGQLQNFSAVGVQGIQVWDVDGNVLRFALTVTGAPLVGVVAAPADGDLAASQVALWFDDTDGAAKLKIKGKSADGTVVTGSVNLS